MAGSSPDGPIEGTVVKSPFFKDLRMVSHFVILALWFIPVVGFAKWTRLPYLGLRPAGMGNAFIALADDKSAFFYNPAGLAQISDINFELYDLGIGADSMDSLNRFNRGLIHGEASESLRSDIQYTRGGYFPAYLQSGIGVGVFTHLMSFTDIRDLDHEEVDLFYANDLGVIVSAAMPLGTKTSVGLTAKVLQRTGLDRTVTPEALLESLNIDRETFLSSIHDSLKALHGKGWGYGFDLGVLVRDNGKKRGTFGSFALVITDILGTAFRAMGESPVPAAIPMGIHLGLGWTQRFSNLSEWNITFDIRNIGLTSSVAQMASVGFEYRLYGLSVLFGAHQGQLTYGLLYENKFLRAGIVSMGAELGSNFYQRPTRFYLVQFALGLHELRR